MRGWGVSEFRFSAMFAPALRPRFLDGLSHSLHRKLFFANQKITTDRSSADRRCACAAEAIRISQPTRGPLESCPGGLWPRIARRSANLTSQSR